MSTKEDILAAVRLKFATKEIFLNDAKTASVIVREMSRVERDTLNAKIFVCGDDGKPITVNADGKPDPKGSEWQYRDGVFLVEEWLSATMVPSFTVQELQGSDWPASLKRTLYQEALLVNSITLKGAVGN